MKGRNYSTPPENWYAIQIDGRTLTMEDGSLAFHATKASAQAELAAFIWTWRGSRRGRRRTAAKQRDAEGRVYYDLKRDGAYAGRVSVVRLAA